MADYSELMELLQTKEGVNSLSPEDLRGWAEEILLDTQGDQRLAVDLLRRAGMLELNETLPRINNEVIEWLSTPAEQRESPYPSGEAIREAQQLLNLEDDGLLGPNTLTTILTEAQTEINAWKQNPDDLLVTPLNFNNVGNLRAFIEQVEPNELLAYEDDFNRYVQGLVGNAAENALLEAHQETLGYCSEVELLSLQSIFENPEQFSDIMRLASSDAVTDMVELNGAIKEVIELNCGHILDKFPDNQRDLILNNASADAQIALGNAIYLSKGGDVSPLPEPPPPPSRLPEGYGPNGEQDASFTVGAPMGGKP